MKGKVILWICLALPLTADLPGEEVMVPPDRVAPSVLRDAIGVWMYDCFSQDNRVPVFRREGALWKKTGDFPLREIQTVTVFAYGLDDVCRDYTILRVIVTDTLEGYTRIVVDVERDQRVWTRIPEPEPEDTSPRKVNDVIWLDRLGVDSTYLAHEVYVVPGFFHQNRKTYLAPRWDATVYSLPREAVMLFPEGRKGNFLRVTRIGTPYGPAPFLYGHIDKDTLWVPVRDRDGKLLLWFWDQTD